MLQPTIPGWKVECIGDDIAWMKIGEDGRLHGINPEAGFFGVAPGTNYESNPMAMDTIRENTIFTNCVLTDDGDVWWEGMDEPCDHGIDWKGKEWTPRNGHPGAHPNARFTAPARQCPVICPDWEDPAGVPIDIFVFGGRRSTVVPPGYRDLGLGPWSLPGGDRRLRADRCCPRCEGGNCVGIPSPCSPFALTTWGTIGSTGSRWGDRLGDKAPKIFYVNWFRKSPDGKWLWPGFGEEQPCAQVDVRPSRRNCGCT